jgi:hypothetical protein
VVTANQNGTDILMPLEVGVSHGILHLGHCVHAPSPFGVLGIIDDQVDGLPQEYSTALDLRKLVDEHESKEMMFEDVAYHGGLDEVDATLQLFLR